MEDKNNGSPVNDEKKPPIPYLAHEAAVARQERTIKRMWILCIIIFIAFVWSNLWWVCYEMQFEDVITVSQDAETDDAPIYLNGTGDLTVNGEGKTGNN